MSSADSVSGGRAGATAVRYAVDAWRPHPWLVARFVAASMGRTVLVMATVLMIRQFLVVVIAKPLPLGMEPQGALWIAALSLVGAYVGASLLYSDSEIVRQRLVELVELSVMERIIRHLLTLSVRFFDRSSHGDLLHAMRTDVGNLRVALMAGAAIFMDGVVAAGLLVSAVWISPQLAFWALVVMPLAAFPVAWIARRTRSRSLNERQSGYLVFDMLLEMLRGIRVIKAFHAEEPQARATLEHAQRYFDEQMRIVRIRGLSNVLLESLAGLSIAAVIIAGGVQVMHGAIEWPQLIAFLMAVRALHGPLDHINVNILEMNRHRAAAERVAALLAEVPEIRDPDRPLPLMASPRQLAFAHVSFTYDGAPVLRNISFTITAGETIGIAGPSGSGKTTLLGLVARFYDPTVGTVSFDGIDVQAFCLHDLYGLIAVVTQQPFVFAASVRANIRCGRPDASDAQVEAAARAAGIHEEIAALPQGYDTRIGAGGRVLSGGQAQRVNIARAVLKNAPILLLDEATASLDSIAEAEVQRAINHLMRGRTTFIVAHRLSALRHADRILVLDRGHAVGLDTHDALLRGCPLYRLMWETQLPEPEASRQAPRLAAAAAFSARR